jgi:hypothetical protein
MVSLYTPSRCRHHRPQEVSVHSPGVGCVYGIKSTRQNEETDQQTNRITWLGGKSKESRELLSTEGFGMWFESIRRFCRSS